MKNAQGITRIEISDKTADPCRGSVFWSPKKSLWLGCMYLGAVIGGSLTFSWSAFVLFLATSALTLCAGHSVGMHRRLIHNSFQCPQWLEYLLVYCGTLMGLAGPFSIIEMHELRDWAQRHPHCHDYFASRQPFWKDWFWVLHCDLKLGKPPEIAYEPRIAQDRIYHFLENTRYLQQIPLAVALYLFGGWSWIIWGVFVRISVCVTGHWLVGYIAHRWGDRNWHIEGAGVQGYNVNFCGLITMGECWHNNHHAFPNSARIGLESGQLDPGWWMIQVFSQLGLAWDIQQPQALPAQNRIASALSTINNLAHSSD